MARAEKLKTAPRRAKGPPGIKSLEIGLRVLRAAATFPAPATLTQISSAARLDLSTCRRYLVSLVNAGMIKQDLNSGKYDLGESLFLMGLRALIRGDVIRATIDRALALNQELDLTVIVSVWGDRGPTVIAWFDCSSKLICNSSIGSVYPMLSTATGRVFLSYLPDESTEPMVGAELGRSPEAMTRQQRERIAHLRETVRRNRLGITDGEVIPGLSAVAAPVFDSHGKIASVIAILAHSPDVGGVARERVIASLQRAADQVSTGQGFVGTETHRSFSEWLESVWRAAIARETQPKQLLRTQTK